MGGLPLPWIPPNYLLKKKPWEKEGNNIGLDLMGTLAWVSSIFPRHYAYRPSLAIVPSLIAKR